MENMERKYRKLTWLPLGLVRDSLNGNWERSLLFYCKLKKAYSKPIVYDYSLRKVATLLECSPTVVKTHLDKLKEKGLVVISNNNLCLVGSTKLQSLVERNKNLVPVEYHNNNKDHLIALYFTVIKRNLHLQEKKIKKLIDIINLQEDKLPNGLSKNYIKSLMRASALFKKNNINVERLIQNCLTLSNAKIGSLVSRKQLSGLKVQKELNRLGYIKSFKRILITGTEVSKSRYQMIQKYNPTNELLGRNKNTFIQKTNLMFLPKKSDNFLLLIKNIYRNSLDTFLLNVYLNKGLIIEGRRSGKSEKGEV